MGQAKNRGTFEQRKAESIRRWEEASVRRRNRKAEVEAALTPDDRSRKQRSILTMAMLLAVLSGYDLKEGG